MPPTAPPRRDAPPRATTSGEKGSGQWSIGVDDAAVVDREKDVPRGAVLHLEVEESIFEGGGDDNAVAGRPPAPPTDTVRIHARRRAVGGENGEAGQQACGRNDLSGYGVPYGEAPIRLARARGRG